MKRDTPGGTQPPTKWVQEDLFGPDVYEITMRIGVVVSGDHCQVQLERREPLSGRLLALWSVHHARLSDLQDTIDRAAAEAVNWVSPF
jgi:hypothetical protein